MESGIQKVGIQNPHVGIRNLEVQDLCGFSYMGRQKGKTQLTIIDEINQIGVLVPNSAASMELHGNECNSIYNQIWSSSSQFVFVTSKFC